MTGSLAGTLRLARIVEPRCLCCGSLVLTGILKKGCMGAVCSSARRPHLSSGSSKRMMRGGVKMLRFSAVCVLAFSSLLLPMV
jgi:hypothetical protein